MSSQNKEILATIAAAGASVRVRPQVSGRELTTFGIGGPLGVLIEPQDDTGLLAALRCVHECGAPYRILGFGSNLLIADLGVPESVIKLGREFRTVIDLGAGHFRVGGAVSMMTLSRKLAEDGWAGLEFAGGIPGSLGGAVVMNAGAHGSDIATVLVAVDFMTPEGRRETVAASELKFSYRHAALPTGVVVVGAEIALVQSDAQSCLRRRHDFLERRKRTQPLTLPSAGSVFQNPEQQGSEGATTASAGAIIERCGLKGHTQGAAVVSELHANWIVNPKRCASAADVAGLIAHVQATVYEKTKVSLKPEIVVWGL